MTLNTDYRQSFFQVKSPTKISGEPDFESLKGLHTQVKINAQCVHSTRGGGTHGHLGLVLSANDYQLLTLTPFIRPADPGEFQVPIHNPNLTMDQVNIMREHHKSLREAFDKVDAVESALKQFIVEAIEPDYLLEIRNSTTQMLEGPIPLIFTRLFAAYGRLTSETLMNKQQAFATYVYNVHSPIDKLFKLAQEYQEYASFHGTPQPATTIITTVYEILRKTGHFTSSLKKWKNRPAPDKTWENFKLHFREASKDLKEYAPTTTSQAGYSNMVNDITSGVANMLQSSDTEDSVAAEAFLNQLTAAVNQSQAGLERMTTQVSSLQDELNSLNAVRSSNNTSNNQASGNRFRNSNPPMYQGNDINQAYQQAPLMPQPGNPQNPPPHSPYFVPYQPFNNNMNNYPPQNYPNPMPPQNYGNQYNSNNNNRRPRSNQGRGYRNNNRQSNNNNWNHTPSSFQSNNNFNNNGSNRSNHYCWTHGRGGHPSSQCRTPSNGHQSRASFNNKMNGNNEGCWN